MTTAARFDATIHAPHRLRICATLDDAREVEFGTLRGVLGVSDSVLSKQIAVLTDAGYVRSRRAKRDTRQRVWLALTDQGRASFRAHVAALHEIVGPGVPAGEASAPPGAAVRPQIAPSW